jgi:hypothetical protein
LSFGGLLLAFVYSAGRLSAGVGEALCVLVGAACFTSTLAAFLVAGRRELVSFRARCVCLAGYLALLACLCTAGTQRGTVPV